MLSSLYKLIIFRFLILLIFSINIIPTNVFCNQKIALFGDSLMSGYGLDKSFHLSTILEKSLKEKGFDVTVINASVSGDTSSGGLNRINWLLKNVKIDIVVLCLGANDMLRGLNPTIVRENLNKILEILKKKKKSILFAGMLSQDTLGKEYKNNFDRIYPDLAEKFKVPFLPFLLHGVALKPEYNLDDGKHPNADGVFVISKNIEMELIRILNNK